MANTQFQVEGNAAQLFERDAVSIFGKPLAELTFEHVSLHDGERILDVACGTGIQQSFSHFQIYTFELRVSEI